MIDINNIATIGIALDKTPRPEYQVVIDWPKEGVLRVARENDKQHIFTVPFYTKDIDDVPDWSDYLEYDILRLVRPICVGHLKPVDKAIDEIIRIMFEDRVPNILKEVEL